jgi:LysM repeat protein
MPRVRLWLARLAAPAALLLAATVAVLLVRSALDSADQARTTTSTPTVTQPAPARPPPARTATTKAEAEFYTVQAGDTLASIADQYGTTVEEILLLNPKVDPVELSIGQRIRVQ